MKKNKISGEDLLAIGYPELKVIGIALQMIDEKFGDYDNEDVLSLLTEVLKEPLIFADSETFSPIATALIEYNEAKSSAEELALKDNPIPYSIFGKENIEEGAIIQMNTAMSLPVTVAGALMADAHQGYGLPIGGVLAANNAVIPYGVGVDIGCRMCLSIYDIPENFYFDNQSKFKRELIAYTKFGAGAGWHGKDKADHAILEREEFRSFPLVKNLFDKAASQLGTSGGGNHFVEWGIIEMNVEDEVLKVPKGKYLALLSHSGSRGFGAMLANHYTRLAKELCALPQSAKNLAYLSLDTSEGLEYWLAMNLAGDYASACHEIIHSRITKAIGGTVLAKVENHHNFAWKEKYNDQEVIVHRKGATPASKGTFGIIPGSMTAPGFLVKGKGEPSSINSASHGAGRQMSRTQAIKTFTKNDMRAILKEHGVTLIGSGIDEVPMAYKNIEAVMSAQSGLVDIIAKFTPKMVRMADDGSRED